MGVGREILKIPFVKPILAIGLGVAALGIYLGDQESKQTPNAPPIAEAPTAPGQTTPLNTQVEAKVLGGFRNPITFTREGFTWKDTNLLDQYQTEKESAAFVGGEDKHRALALARCAAALDLKRVDAAEGQALIVSYSARNYSDVAAKCEAQYRGTNRSFIVR